MIRQIIRIDQDKCTGCNECVPGCPEGAIQIIDGKARLISDLFCDGLGACLGHCPEAAITIEEREAEPYDEVRVMENIVKHGENTVAAHLEHLHSHGETKYYQQAIDYLRSQNMNIPLKPGAHQGHGASPCGCPGSTEQAFNTEDSGSEAGTRQSQLRHWPIQGHLISPMAPYYQGADVLLSADCVAFSFGEFHRDYLKGKSLVIACPKLDDRLESYAEKITALIDQAKINTLTVIIMEVPCCGGLVQIAKEGAGKAGRKIPIKMIVVGIKGNIVRDEWV
jgi:ferredoxin